MSRRRIRDGIVFLFLTFVVWSFYNANRKEIPELNGYDKVILRISAPIERAFIAVFDAWIKVWKEYRYLVELKKENQKLERENEKLAANNRFLAALADRGRELARFETFMRDSAAEMLAASVIRRRIDTEKFRVIGIVIDRRWGEVECGSPVITPGGVVGRVRYFEGGAERRPIPCPVREQLKRRRYRRYRGKLGRAMVQLTVDPGNRIAVVIPRTGVRGVLRGLGWEKGYAARIAHLGPKAKVEPGDLVVTSGVDGRFPEGLPVGRILRAQQRAGQSLEVLVRPSVDFGKLTRVLVVVSAPPPKVPVPPKRRVLARVGLAPYP